MINSVLCTQGQILVLRVSGPSFLLFLPPLPDGPLSNGSHWGMSVIIDSVIDCLDQNRPSPQHRYGHQLVQPRIILL